MVYILFAKWHRVFRAKVADFVFAKRRLCLEIGLTKLEEAIPTLPFQVIPLSMIVTPTPPELEV